MQLKRERGREGGREGENNEGVGRSERGDLKEGFTVPPVPV
jgi:hypothetical protein